jgi:hypothetical protein
MFRAPWSWIVPLMAALGVFVGVLLITPPGFGAVSETLFGSPRGVIADAAAYALGAAASLALVALLGVAVACSCVELALRRLR